MTPRPPAATSEAAPAASLQHLDGTPLRVLVVDDEPMLSELLQMALRYEGWQVNTAATGSEAVTLARTFDPDAVVLDVMLPDMDGLACASPAQSRPRRRAGALPHRQGRCRGSGRRADRWRGRLRHQTVQPRGGGGPVARVMRRAHSVSATRPDPQLVVGDLVLDEDTQEVWRAGSPIELTATEFELLRFFMRNPRSVLSKAQILDRVWDYDFGGQVECRGTLRVLPAQEDRRQP